MIKILALAAILAVLVSVQVHCTQTTLQDVLEERLKHMTNVTDEGAGLPRVSTSKSSSVIAVELSPVESGPVASAEEAIEPRACSCESDKSQVTADQSVQDEKPQPYSRTAKKLKEKAKKYKVVTTIMLPEESEAEPETNTGESIEPAEIVSVDVPKSKDTQEIATEAPEELIESEELESVKVDKRGKGKNDKRKEEKKSKSGGKREKRSTKKGEKGKSSERKSKESSKGKNKRSKSKK